MNNVHRSITALICLFLSQALLVSEGFAFVSNALPTNVYADDNKKVVVSSLKTQKKEQLLAVEFEDLDALLEYKLQWLVSAPDKVLSAFLKFKDDNVITQGMILTPEQSLQYTLALVDVYLVQSEFDSAIFELEQITIDELPPLDKIKILEKKSYVFRLQNNYFNAIQSLYLANDIANSQVLTRQSIFIALKLSALFIDISDLENAIKWQTQASTLLAKQDDLVLTIETSILLAKQQKQLKQYLNATKTLTKVIDEVASKKYFNVEITLRIQLSKNFMAAAQYLNAEQELEKAYKLAVKVRDQEQQLIAIIGLINNFNLQQKYTDAQPLLKAAQRLERFLSSPQDIREFVLVKANFYAGILQYSKALDELNQLDTSDILDNQTRQALTINLQSLKSKWLVLAGNKQQGVLGYQALVELLDLQNNQSNANQLHYVLANYQQDLLLVKQQVIEANKLVDVIKGERQSVSNKLNIMLLLLFVAIIFIFVRFKRSQPNNKDNVYLDPITGARNHSYFVKHLNLLMVNDEPFSLVMLDIDNMRKINQNLGHQLGDRLLKKIVERLEVRLGSNKLLVRLSGDRFIVIAKNFSLNQGFALAEILRKELNSNKFYIDNLGINLSASFGVTYYYENKTIDSMKDEVQDALDKAKIKGGNVTQVVGFC